jgi:L-rhamnonate dehydratase
MRRRRLLSGLPALGAVSLWGPLAADGAGETPAGNPRGRRLRALEIWQLRGHRPPSEGFLGWNQSHPTQLYEARSTGAAASPPPRRAPQEGPQAYDALYLRLVCDDGLEGLYGPIDHEAAIVVERQLKEPLLAEDPFAGEGVWDRLFRRNRHARAGHYMMALSAVDNVLWDLRGRRAGQPVYRLLGGPTREAVEVYASCLGYSVEPEDVRQRCVKVRADGFRLQKWFFTDGPARGPVGLVRNVTLARVLRETLGEATELMFDAFMGWDADYALAWAKQVEPLRPRWLEEPFAPAPLDPFVRLARGTSIPIAAGEHLYNRWEVHEYLKAGAVSVVQADPEWCGGVSELVKICALASVYGVQVVPHGHGLHAALHVIASQSPAVCPYGEYLLNKMDHHCWFEKNAPRAVDGRVRLRDSPGFGIELDEARIEERRRLSWE